MLPEAGVASGFRIWQANCAIKNLGVINFANSGIVFETPSSTNNAALGCSIGLDATGTNAAPNRNDGMLLYRGAKNNFIGGTNVVQRNVISGNAPYGIQISGTNTAGTTILGNYIGTAATGESALSTNSPGICIFDGASGITIGGLNGGRNVISGNMSQGIFLDGVSNVFVMGNYIGTAASGTNVVVNGFPGIEMVNGALNVVIGGTNFGSGNLISGNTGSGITVNGSSKIVIQGNYIGTDASGNKALGNDGPGILTFNNSHDLLISGNLISGNLADGAYLENTHQSVVQGNYIGINANGSAALPNAYSGINILNGASGMTIGGTTTVARNVISGNTYHGIQVSAGASNNIIEGNFVGTDISGSAPLGNGVIGIYFFNGPHHNSVGLKTDASGAGNVIAFNGYTGVQVDDTNSIGNTIRGNAIFNNGGLGIDLANPAFSGVTPNDFGDADVGPNNLQNFPVITNAFGSGPNTIISGTLNSTPSRTFWIDVYRNATADPSGYGQGQTYVGSVSVNTTGSGNAVFSLTAAGNFSGQYFSATATDQTTGDTSEFNADVLATNGPAPPTFVAPISLTSTGFTTKISLTIGQNYRVQAATNLAANPIAWTDLTNFIASATNLIFLDRNATNFPRRFYRIVSP
jgi:parallel beta-helix repeat protein